MLYMEKKKTTLKIKGKIICERKDFLFLILDFFSLLLNDSNVTHGVYFKTDILKERFVLFEP